MDIKHLIEHEIKSRLSEGVDLKVVASKYRKMGWSVYVSKTNHRTENDARLEFDKDGKEFEVIGSGNHWEVFTGPTLSGKGKMFNDLEKAINSQIGK